MVSVFNRLLHLIILALFAANLTACNTTSYVNELEYVKLDKEIEALKNIRDSLTLNPKPSVGSVADVFISSESLDVIFKKFDGLDFGLEGFNNITFKVNSIRTDFRNGVAGLILDLSAINNKFGFEVKLVSVAEIFISQKPSNKNVLQADIHIAKIAPQAKWWIFKIRFMLFVRQLLRIEAQKFADRLPKLELPIQTQIDFEIGKKAEEDECMDLGDSAHLCGKKKNIRAAGKLDMVLHRSYVLEDGIHVYLKAIDNDKN